MTTNVENIKSMGGNARDMHTSGKILTVIGGLVCLVGIIGFAEAGAAVDLGTSDCPSMDNTIPPCLATMMNRA